jgi:vancomycin resistance protein YoaR
VVVNGKLVPGVGGGVCQVSSTLYNAVLLAGVKTVKRSRHSIAAAYVPPGRDATVAYGYLDYQFQNNTQDALVVDTEVGPNWVEVRLLGSPNPRRTVAIEVVTERVIAPRVVENPDKDLAFGHRVVASKGAPGFKVRVWRVFREDGCEIRREVVSTDEYLPLDGIVRVGTSRNARRL